MNMHGFFIVFFFSSRRRHTRYWRDWSSDVCSSDLDEDLQDHIRPGDDAGGPRLVYRALDLGPLAPRVPDPDLPQRDRVVHAVVHHLDPRSEEHTSALQSRQYLVCRLMLGTQSVNTAAPC